MMIRKSFINCAVFLFPLVALSGCASIVSGKHQTIDIATNPSGAKCALYRDGEKIGTVDSTPGSVTVSRKSSDLTIGCTKDNYDFSKSKNESDVNGWVFGNLGIGGILGLVVDFATGSIYAYDSNTTVDMQHLLPGVGAPAALPDQFPGSIVRVAPVSATVPSPAPSSK